MKYTQVEVGLRKVLGDKSVDELLKYCFEYATQEASFLQLKQSCKGRVAYKIAFEALCVYRRNSELKEIYDNLVEFAEVQGLEFNDLEGRLKLDLNDYSQIEALIHKKYYPPKINNNEGRN